MLPKDYVGLVVADTRRATQWEAGLRRAGCDVLRVETRGEDADKGAWQIAVRRRDAATARKLVARVLSGEESLPSRLMLSRSGTIALVAICLVLAIMLAAGALSR